MLDDSQADPRQALLGEFQRLRSLAQEKASLGRLADALTDLDQAIEVARLLGDRELIDRAVVNRLGTAIELGATQGDLVELGQMLLRSTSSEIRFLAAYNLAWAYKSRGETDRAASYAGRALRVARELGNSEWMASAENLLGLALLSGSYFEQAAKHFLQGLDLLPKRREKRYAVLLDNYGYCLIVQGRHEEGFHALLESLRTLRRLGERWVQTAPHISLCFAYLEIGKCRSALRHGLAALRLAEDMEDAASLKAALYLLGEAAKQSGDDFAARRYFQRLQEVFFPQAPELIDLLLVVDARTMVNLKA